MNIQGKNKDLELYNKEGVKVYKYYTYSYNAGDESTFDEKGNILTFKNSNGHWDEYTFDEKGNILTYKDSYGTWDESTFDEKGNRLTFKHSDGSWYECTYDEKGNRLTFKNSYGVKRGFDIPEYTMENLVEKLGDFKLIK